MRRLVADVVGAVSIDYETVQHAMAIGVALHDGIIGAVHALGLRTPEDVDVLGLPEREATALKGALRPHRGPQYDPQPGDKSTHTATGTVATVTVRKREDITVTYTNEKLQTPPTTLSGSVDAWSRGGPEWVFSRPEENTAQHNPQPGDVLVEPLLVCLTREHTVLSRSGRGVRIRTVDPLSGTSEETVDLLSWRREIPRGRVWSRPCP